MKRMLTTAGALSASDVGKRISLKWQFPNSHVDAVVTGDLMHVHHNSHVTIVVLHGGGPTTDEFTVRHDVDVDAVLDDPAVTE